MFKNDNTFEFTRKCRYKTVSQHYCDTAKERPLQWMEKRRYCDLNDTRIFTKVALIQNLCAIEFFNLRLPDFSASLLKIT